MDNVSLKDLFLNYNRTMINKWLHYMDIYQKYFDPIKNRKEKINILEIGVFQGGSIELWNNYFGPSKCNIYGIDIEPKCKKVEELYGNVKILIGDQGDKNFLNNIISQLPDMDIIIDDGSHMMNDQITTFEILFPKVIMDGIYICEDLHTSYWPICGGGYKKDGTFIEYIKNYIDKLNAYHCHDNDWCEKNSNLHIDNFTKTCYSMHFYDSIVVLEKSQIDKPISILKGTPIY